MDKNWLGKCIANSYLMVGIYNYTIGTLNVQFQLYLAG